MFEFLIIVGIGCVLVLGYTIYRAKKHLTVTRNEDGVTIEGSFQIGE
jgi:hypothetical protein